MQPASATAQMQAPSSVDYVVNSSKRVALLCFVTWATPTAQLDRPQNPGMQGHLRRSLFAKYQPGEDQDRDLLEQERFWDRQGHLKFDYVLPPRSRPTKQLPSLMTRVPLPSTLKDPVDVKFHVVTPNIYENIVRLLPWPKTRVQLPSPCTTTSVAEDPCTTTVAVYDYFRYERLKNVYFLYFVPNENRPVCTF
ncbi:hypothetical protein TRIUR3_17154 [Triticum urartu]|uniref:Uncharacterized protein n=1 Tax=Triticum urartu TaxID=4572 RepID=M7ZEJ9_TRIUA|nr:hypothetical protein TRIUR3_17154 [Triticum urartu]